MTANVTDLTRVTGTIACSGADAANPITSTVLRSALGYNEIGLCTIGSSDGYYTQFGFRVDTTGGRTWDFAVDDIGDGTYVSLKTGLASGTNVTVGIIPGAFSDGTVVGARRPFSFLVTLSSADADSVVSFAAMRVLPNDARMVAADLTSTNTAIANLSGNVGVSSGNGSIAADIGTPNVTLAADLAAVATSLSNASGTAGDALDQITQSDLPEIMTAIRLTVLATATLDGATPQTLSEIYSSDFVAAYDGLYTGAKAIITQTASGLKTVKTIDGSVGATGQVYFPNNLAFLPVNGDTVVIVP